MNPKERIQSILNRKPVDRIPIDIWHTPEIFQELQQHTGKEAPLDVYSALGLDKLANVSVPYLGKDGAKAGSQVGAGVEGLRTMWGAKLVEQQAGEALYHEVGEPPLLGYDTVESLDTYPWWPDPERMDYDAAAENAKNLSKEFATLGPWVSFFEIYCQMRGIEQALMDVMLDPPYVQAVLDRIEEIQTRILENHLARTADDMDCIFVSDDMGSQNGLLISLESWDQFFKDRMKRWCDLIHKHDCKVFYHSDGAMADLLPRLIDAGIDVLNPIQHVCAGMDMEKLKTEYGKDLVFHGGVDNQRVLPFGTADEVREETQACLDTLGKDGGGFICCSCHNIQPGTPVENILTMIETVKGK